jgi:peptidoglycan/LPS O-acetylase OafA/YrhL
LRLAPAAWLCASATAALLLSTGQFGADIMMSWVRSVLFWPIGAPIDMSYWTLGVESFFYLLVAAVIGSRGTRERIERIGIALGILSGGTWLLTLGWPGWTGGIVANQAATLLQVPFGVFFAIGIFITTSRGRRLGLAHAGYAAFLVIAAIIEIDRHAAGRAAAMGVPTSSAVAIGIFLAGLAIIIAAPVLQRPLSRWLSPATARTIGLMTYPLYLIHQDAGAVVMARLLAAGMPMPIAQAITAATMVGAAWAIARWPEPWLRDRLAIAFNRRRGRAPDNRPTAFPSAG